MEENTFKRQLGIIGGISLAAGSTIGSGIFTNPTLVLGYTGSVGASLLIWAACGINAILCGFSYLEVALLIRQSGGTYAYWHEAFGPVPAYFVCWFWSVIDGPAGLVIVGLTLADNILAPFYPGCYPPQTLVKMVAFIAVLLLSVMNGYSVPLSNKLQIVTMAGKILVLGMIGGAGIYNIIIGQTGSLSTGFEGSSTNVADYAVAFYTCMWSYGGWERVCQCFEEIKNPSRNIPIIIGASILLTTTIYVTVNIAYFTVMTPAEFLQSSAVAVTFGDRMFGSFSWIIPAGIALSTLGSMNGICWAYSRIPFIGARKNQLPKHLGLISYERKTPLVGQSFLLIIATIMVIPESTNIASLIDYVSPLTWILASGVFASIFVFRAKKKDKREFRVPLIIPIVCLITNLASIFIPIIMQPSLEYLIGAAVIAAGYLIYIPFFYFDVDFPGSDKIYVFLQIFFECVPNDFSEEKLE